MSFRHICVSGVWGVHATDAEAPPGPSTDNHTRHNKPTRTAKNPDPLSRIRVSPPVRQAIRWTRVDSNRTPGSDWSG